MSVFWGCVGFRVARRSHCSFSSSGSSTVQGVILGLEAGCWEVVGEGEVLVRFGRLEMELVIADP